MGGWGEFRPSFLGLLEFFSLCKAPKGPPSIARFRIEMPFLTIIICLDVYTVRR